MPRVDMTSALYGDRYAKKLRQQGLYAQAEAYEAEAEKKKLRISWASGVSHRVYLDSKYEDRFLVSSLGALYDGSVRRWYIPPNTSHQRFARFLTQVWQAKYREAGLMK